MESLWAWTGMDPATYFNVSLVFLLRSCHQATMPSEDEQDIVDSDDPAVSNGEEVSVLNDLFSWLLGEEGDVKNLASSSNGMFWALEEENECEDLVHTSVGGSFSAPSAVKLFLGSFLALFLALLISFLVWKKLVVRPRKGPVVSPVKTETTQQSGNNIQSEKQGEGNKAGNEHPAQDKDVKGKDVETVPHSDKLISPVVVPLSNTASAKHSQESVSLVRTPDSSQFLSSTVDHLMAQLDWTLGLAADESSLSSEHMSTATASFATPQLHRKKLTRRPRWQTMTSLPHSAGSVSPHDKLAVRMWQKLERMERKMNWKQLDVDELDITAVEDGRLSAVLQFYQQVCPVPSEQWNASCLIVNYVLTLLEQELAFSADKSALKFLDFHSFGSASNQTCITRANRFDVMVVMQVPFCSEMSVYHSEVCDEIPTGKLVLGLKESPSTAGRAYSLLLQKDRIGESFGTFLSVREVVKMTHRLVSDAVDRLKLKNKSLLDRLSFSIQLAQYENLVLSINTKLLSGAGLGLSEISIHLTPAFRVSPPESNPLPPVFAVPPWVQTKDSSELSRSRIQSRIMRNRNQGVPLDLLWQVNGSELAKSFMASAESRLFSAGVSGCQVMCQLILRALFSRSGKDTLLTTGEIHPQVLDSVVFFLLLESPPPSWDLSCLSDRLSDCVHFLRSAVQSAWMPGFLVHNPHLMNQMPVLKMQPLLAASRQENILASVGPDAVDSILSFMESRLQETGLSRCLKEEYSSEMWEYEFFIFG